MEKQSLLGKVIRKICFDIGYLAGWIVGLVKIIKWKLKK